MPKIKTRRAAAKRFVPTGSGEFKRAKAFKSHILEKNPRLVNAIFAKQLWLAKPITNALLNAYHTLNS